MVASAAHATGDSRACPSREPPGLLCSSRPAAKPCEARTLYQTVMHPNKAAGLCLVYHSDEGDAQEILADTRLDAILTRMKCALPHHRLLQGLNSRVSTFRSKYHKRLLMHHISNNFAASCRICIVHALWLQLCISPQVRERA